MNTARFSAVDKRYMGIAIKAYRKKVRNYAYYKRKEPGKEKCQKYLSGAVRWALTRQFQEQGLVGIWDKDALLDEMMQRKFLPYVRKHWEDVAVDIILRSGPQLPKRRKDFDALARNVLPRGWERAFGSVLERDLALKALRRHSKVLAPRYAEDLLELYPNPRTLLEQWKYELRSGTLPYPHLHPPEDDD